MLCSIVRTWECWGNLSGMLRPVICYRAAPGILLSSCPYTTGSAFTVAVWRPVLIGLPCSVSATHLTRVDRAKSSAGGHIPLCLKPRHKQELGSRQPDKISSVGAKTVKGVSSPVRSHGGAVPSLASITVWQKGHASVDNATLTGKRESK